MQIIAYLGFTLLSVCIQFSIIDFIQGTLKLDEKLIENKGVSQKRQLKDVVKDINFKPHALYYRTQNNKGLKSITPAKFISNITLTELLATTDMTTTVLDILYDENTTIAEDSFTTESFYTTTDVENITEITFFEKSNETTSKIDTNIKKTVDEDCSCNLLIKICDINCCCDKDCLDSDTSLFPNCAKNRSNTKETEDIEYCISRLPFIGDGNGLFCIVKVNLPETKNLVMKKTGAVPTNYYLTWKSNEKSQTMYEFSNSMYKYGDPIWLFKNGTIYHTDASVPRINSYCSGREAVQFLKDEKYKCNVKIGDLEMFPIIKSLEEVAVISATPLSMNSSVLNCTNLHCVNWTTIVCENLVCTKYNKSFHEPTCTDTICSNVALKIDYYFFYHDMKIVNATIKLHLENISMALPFLMQEIRVKFVVGNESTDKILKLSGNPGYQDGLPLIISYAENNYTDAFYNSTMSHQRHLELPENKNGVCKLLNNSDNFVLFGRNRRIHCRYDHKLVNGNATEQCQFIQSEINRFFKMNRQMLVSPLGNPYQLQDNAWVILEKSLHKGTILGKIQERSLKLLCINLVSGYSMTFKYAQINGNSKILSANYKTTLKNVTFNMDDIASVITIDITFIDVTKPSVFEHVTGHPSVNLHLPDDFFYPFRSNESHVFKTNVFAMILHFIIIIYFLQIK